VGFTGDEIDELLAGLEGALDLEGIDQVPEPPDDPVTRPGDVWLLGNHRLLCGDAGQAEDVDRLLAGAVIHLVNTDPPYNVKVEPRSNNAIAAGVSSFSRREDLQCARSTTERGKKDRKRTLLHHQSFDLHRGKSKARGTTAKMRPKDRPLQNDFVSDEAFAEMLLAWFGNMSRVLIPGGGFYVWGGYSNFGNYPPALKASGLYFSQAIIWDKEHPVLTRKDFLGCFEVCYYGWKLGAAHRFFGPPNVPDLWHVKKVNPASMVHLTEKPVELATRALEYSSQRGEHVLDLFGGSGSTLIAAEALGRRAYVMEIDPAYCDVIVTRWQALTQRTAVLEGTDRAFGDVKEERSEDHAEQAAV
ncbi:MAG: site-specific DNA-methyltransferase, partial [Planctomycetes bacterium]|nr:site-specific DNA-methyltransferase [Planctomycetota bacterium]